jgi:formiminoglutamase
MNSTPDWLTIERRDTPLILSFPHTGTTIPPGIEVDLHDARMARRDADWWIDTLYGFARALGATFVHTAISRTVIDVNRDPSGVSLYPGQATTELVPLTTFDGEPLWKPGREPDAAAIAARQAQYFDPYHAALAGEITRLRANHPRVVLYDCHSIRSVIPRLFDGELPNFNIGTNSGASCAPALQQAVADICAASPLSSIVNGRFKGGYITRHHGRPDSGVHAVQMELACRGYMREPVADFSDAIWPTPFDDAYAAPIRTTLRQVLDACLAFTRN